MLSSPPESGRNEAAAETALEARVAELEDQVRGLQTSDDACILVFSNDWERVLSAFVVAVTSAASGMGVTMFFNMWGTTALLDPTRRAKGKTLVERVFGFLLPEGYEGCRLSKLHFGGLGQALMRREMGRKGIADIPELIEQCAALGVRIRACEMTMSLMGIRPEELRPYPHLEICGAARFMEGASSAQTTLVF